jgi:hypothetical protein
MSLTGAEPRLLVTALNDPIRVSLGAVYVLIAAPFLKLACGKKLIRDTRETPSARWWNSVEILRQCG